MALNNWVENDTESDAQITERRPVTRQKRILIVDDEGFNQMGLMAMIETMRQFEGLLDLVDTANDGLECVKKAKAGLDGQWIYSLVFMDLSMPNMDGFEATEALREIYE